MSVATAEVSGKSRLDAARELAAELLEELEVGSAPIEKSLSKALRLARLLRHTDAQTWLSLELRGYPLEASKVNLGVCGKYAWRFLPQGKVYTPSLPAVEAEVAATEIALNAVSIPSFSPVVENHIAKTATQEVINNLVSHVKDAKNAFVNASSQFSKLKAGIHDYVADTAIALEFGDVAQDIFVEARRTVDAFVSRHVPKAVEQLVAVNDRMKEGDSEALSAALTACRRLLVCVADAVFPASDKPYVDGSGKERKVGNDEYKNRLLAFIETKSKSGSTTKILEGELAHLAARLDAVSDKASKGVHDVVTAAETRLTVIQCYLFIAELARANG